MDRSFSYRRIVNHHHIPSERSRSLSLKSCQPATFVPYLRGRRQTERDIRATTSSASEGHFVTNSSVEAAVAGASPAEPTLALQPLPKE
jgi:hypothetical protein